VRLAAIDVGTNTTRLLVAEARGGSYRDLDRRLAFTRLGEGVDARGMIRETAIRRTLLAIAEFCSVCGEFGVQRITLAGTSAVRDAANRWELLEAAGRLTGGSAVAVSGEEEARLSFLGASAGRSGEALVVCDIGGGSTEFVAGVAPQVVSGRTSLDLGSVRLTERHLHSDPPATEEIITMEDEIDRRLADADGTVLREQGALFVGLGGTVTTLAAISLGIEHYRPELVHGSRLDSDALKGIYQSLAAMTNAERAALPMLPAGRADVIVAGAAILVRALTRWSIRQVLVSEKDILDGLVIQMLGETG
jgi:exopolyphosphatase/guanosine-5'-triphosphate,3'-diphosphate pyrophosphatase